MNLRKCRKIRLRVPFDVFLGISCDSIDARRGLPTSRNRIQWRTLACVERRRSRGQPPKVTWQAGSAVRVGAGLPFSQSTAAWPLDPARFHRGIETWTVVGGEIPSSIDRRARHAGMPISSLSLRAADRATRACVMNHACAHHEDPRILRRATLPPSRPAIAGFES